jgi:hypothetical protein
MATSHAMNETDATAIPDHDGVGGCAAQPESMAEVMSSRAVFVAWGMRRA